VLKDVHDKSIKEEGERMVPAFHKGALVYGEHLVRYKSIEPLIKGKTVLDIASGSGYGTYMIAGDAAKVFGVEIDQDSLEYSNKNYSRGNIEYKLGSAEKIPLDDASVDVVVSFETIEHVKNYTVFLKEIRRVIKPGGVAIISTPNDPEFSEHNQFHLHEFEYRELKNLLKNYFKNVELLYQSSWYYSALLKQDEIAQEWKKNIETDNFAPIPNDKALYFLAVCSDTNLSKLPQPLSLGALSEKFSPRQQEKLIRDKEEADRLIEELQTKVTEKHEELQSLYHSRGWRILQKLYRVEAAILKLVRRK